MNAIRRSEKESVALGSVFASGGLALMKLVVGLMTGSIAILSEAAHSLLDLGAAGLTYFAVRISDKPADLDHPYGHAKIESVSALIETGLLFVTSGIIVKEAIDRLLAEESHVEATWYAVAVIVASIVIDWFRARALLRVARATQSQALEADALHFSSDILSSAAVLVGLGFVALGHGKADALAALAVAVVVCRAGWQLGRRTIDILIDTAPEGVAERVEAVVRTVAGVARVDRIRVRPAGKTIFIDLAVSVSRTLAMNRVREISNAAVARIRSEYPDADVTVHAQPLALDNETIVDQVDVIAAGLGLSVHHVIFHRLQGHVCVGFDLEVDGHLSIKEAHEIASRLEAAIRTELGEDVIVESHIDSREADESEEAAAVEPALTATVGDTIRAAATGITAFVDVHNVQVRRLAHGLHVAFHCRFDDDAPLQAVDDAVRHLEYRLYERIPEARRIIAHAEPVRHED